MGLQNNRLEERIYEQGKTIDRLSQSEIHLGEVVRQQGIVIDRMQGQLAKYKANLDQLLTGLNERDRIVEREEKKIHERLNRHRYDIQEQDKVVQGIDRKVGIQAHEIDSLKERVSYYDDQLLDVSLLGLLVRGHFPLRLKLRNGPDG